MAFETSIGNGIAEVVFNKPPVNAFNSQEWASIASHLHDLGEHNELRVIVIRAE